MLIQRSRYAHPEIPDAIAVFGVIARELSMYYYDSRGVHRVFTLSFGERTLRSARNAAPPDLSQRMTFTINDDGNTVAGQGELVTGPHGETTWRSLTGVFADHKCDAERLLIPRPSVVAALLEEDAITRGRV